MSRNEMFANGSRVYNLDETGVTTVLTPRKVIGEKDAKQVYQITIKEKMRFSAGKVLASVSVFFGTTEELFM